MADEIIRRKNFCGIALRQIKDTLADSVYAQLKWAIDKLGFTEYFKFTVSPLQITKTDTGQIIYFRGCDEPVKIKSIKPPGDMHIGVVWFEEKDQLNGIEAVRSIQQSVMRGGDDIIVLSSYNTPLSRKHFLNADANANANANVGRAALGAPQIQGNANQIQGTPRAACPTQTPVTSSKPNRIIHHSYYYDTPREWLGQPFLDEAAYLKSVNEKAYNHEYLGEAIGEGGNIFENITVKNINNLCDFEPDRFWHGIDWGYYPDPWAYVKCCYAAKERRLYIIDEAGEYKKSNQETGRLLINEKKLTKNDIIICDSAEPKSIKDYKTLGLYALGAEKGSGSAAYSTKWLQGLAEIVIRRGEMPENGERIFGVRIREKRGRGNYIGIPRPEQSFYRRGEIRDESAVETRVSPVFTEKSPKLLRRYCENIDKT
jgi:PBSX family phage terminase large subunit